MNELSKISVAAWCSRCHFRLSKRHDLSQLSIRFPRMTRSKIMPLPLLPPPPPS